MSNPAAITAAVLDRILAFLAPLFLDSATGDAAAARQAAADTIAGYNAQTDRELRLAALTIAFSFGALDSLSRAADPGLPVNQVMRLRGNANALHRAGQQNEVRLDKLRRQPPLTSEHAEPRSVAVQPEPTDDFPASSAAPDLLAFARSALQSMMSGAAADTIPAPPLSRQQRRAAERDAEKVRRRQQEAARRAQWTADRAAARHEPAPQAA